MLLGSIPERRHQLEHDGKDERREANEDIVAHRAAGYHGSLDAAQTDVGPAAAGIGTPCNLCKRRLFTSRKFLDQWGSSSDPSWFLLSTSIQFQPVAAVSILACALLPSRSEMFDLRRRKT